MEEELTERLRRWCAYQERCTAQLHEKMRKMDLNEEQKERFIELLKTENFLNDERFAISFASGKIRIKKWGRVKVRAELSRLKIGTPQIELALNSIDEDEYNTLVIETARKKSALMRESDKFVKTGKLANFLLSKGVEQEQAWKAAKLVVA